MKHETVTLKMSHDLLSDAGRLAATDDITIGHLVRQLLKKEVDRRLLTKTPCRTDERLLSALQALLARDMAQATSWHELSLRLARHGYELRPVGGDVTLYKRSCGTRICKASDIGFSYRMLVKRFAAGMPRHPHGALNIVFDAPNDTRFDVIDMQ